MPINFDALLGITDAALLAMLHEDIAFGDLTTSVLGIGDQPGRLSCHARQAMTACATEEACRLFTLMGATAQCRVCSGSTVAAGTLLLTATGSAAQLHLAWKTAQTLIEWASGIASKANAIVTAAHPVAVACTRKNTPGTKAMSAKAVRSGGARLHRLGLSETLLIFREHRCFLNETPQETVNRLKAVEPEKKIVVEVDTIEEGLQWSRAGVDVLQLEKFPSKAVAECTQALRRDGWRGLMAVGGGIDEHNAAEYVAAGANLLITSAPYHAGLRDVQVDFKPGVLARKSNKGLAA